MGSFIYMINGENTAIIEEKRQEFEQRLERVFNESGMMRVEHLQLYGRKINTLRPIKIENGYTTFYYNQIEEDVWENAGYEVKEGVYSNKVGWRAFSASVAAAYILQIFYMNGPAYVLQDGYLITPWRYMEWFKYLFNETYRLPDTDLMRMVELFHEQEISLPGIFNHCGELANSGYSIESIVDAIAVIHGMGSVRELMEVIGKDERQKERKKGMFYYDTCVLEISKNIEQFKKNSVLNDEQQVQHLMDIIRKLADANEITERSKDAKEGFELQLLIEMTSNYAVAIEKIAELYNKDFWELYQPFIGRKRNGVFFSNAEDVQAQMIKPISTSELFCECDDDMLAFWKPDRNMQLSVELENWFAKLKQQFDIYVKEEQPVTKAIRQIIDDLHYANSYYLNIYVNADFLEESLDNIQDARYQAVWRIFHDMVHSPEMMEEGNRILDQKALKKGIRQTKYSWTMTDTELKRNSGRLALKRYLALVANRELREKIFGF